MSFRLRKCAGSDSLFSHDGLALRHGATQGVVLALGQAIEAICFQDEGKDNYAAVNDTHGQGAARDLENPGDLQEGNRDEVGCGGWI